VDSFKARLDKPVLELHRSQGRPSPILLSKAPILVEKFGVQRAGAAFGPLLLKLDKQHHQNVNKWVV
jgi:hypothetical protein